MKKMLLIFCLVFCPSLAAMECSVTKEEECLLSFIQLFLDRGGKIDGTNEHGFTLLHSCARAGYKKACQFLLNHQADVCLVDSQGKTPLHWAAIRGYTAICRMLLHNGADMCAVDNLGATPMLFAALNKRHDIYRLFLQNNTRLNELDKNGNAHLCELVRNNCAEAIRMFLGHGGRAIIEDSEGNTPLMYSALRGNLELCKLFLELKVPVNHISKRNATALHRAAESGSKDVCELLLEEDAKVNVQDDLGFTPLHWAAGKGYAYICELLLKHGATLDVESKVKVTALECATFTGNKEVCFLLVDKKALIRKEEFTPLHLASDSGNVELCGLFLAQGIPIDARDAKGSTPLHRAASRGRAKVCAFLLDNGADIEAKNNNEEAPIDKALQKDHEEAAVLLLLRGAKLFKDRHEKCLHNAAKKGHVSLCKVLLKWFDPSLVLSYSINTPKMNSFNCMARTPLMVASAYGHEEICKILLAHKAKIDEKLSTTALIEACFNGHYEIVKLLVEAGARISVRNDVGNTPLYVAAREGNFEICVFLIAQGARVTASGKYGEKPIHAAAWKGDLRIVNLLLEHGACAHSRTDLPNRRCLEFAARSGDVATCRRFIELGEFVSHQNSFGESPFKEAVKKGHTKVCELFLNEGVSIQYERQVLVDAAFNKDPKMCRFLLLHGASLCEKDGHGNTPLIRAAKRNSEETCRALIEDALWYSFGPQESPGVLKKIGAFLRGPSQLNKRLVRVLFYIKKVCPTLPFDVLLIIIKYDDELYRYMMNLLVLAAKEGRAVPKRFLPHVASEIAGDIQQKLSPLMLEARKHRGRGAWNEPRSKLLPDLLNPKNFECFFGAYMKKNVLARLKELQYDAKERAKKEE